MRFLRCRGVGSEADPTDESELDMREIVPWGGETAETEKLIGPMWVRRTAEELPEVLFMRLVRSWLEGLKSWM